MRNGRAVSPSTQMTVEEVMAEAGVGKNTAYQIIKQLNAELEAMGKLTFRGRVNRRYFEEKVCYNGKESGYDNSNYGLTLLAERMTSDIKGKESGDNVQSQQILSRICGMCYTVEAGGGDFRTQVGKSPLPYKIKADGQKLISMLEAQRETVAEFDKRLWGAMVDYVTVGVDKRLTVVFRYGTGIGKNCLCTKKCHMPMITGEGDGQ